MKVVKSGGVSRTFILVQVTFVAIMRIRSDIYQEGSFTEPWLTTGIMRAPAQECCLYIPYLNNGSFILLIVTLTRILKTQLTIVEK